MANTAQKTARNQSMEWCKMIAAVFVVFIHVKFPREIGEIATCLARFAVPMFFAISGYFNLYATSRQLVRRMGSIGKLTLFSFLLYILWGCCTSDLASAQDVLTFLFRDGRALWDLLLLQASPYPNSGHLWYLLSLLLCYLVLWGYTCFWEGREILYRPLYLAGFCLFSLYFTMTLLLPYAGVTVPFQVYRNGWFTGIPMFLMGMFLRQYREEICRNFRLTGKKLAALAVLGMVLSLLQWRAGSTPEIPLGTFLEVPALLLLMAQYPRIPVQGAWFPWLTARLGTWSTAIYVVHLLVLDIYQQHFQAMAEGIFGTREDWARPILVVGLSLMAAVVWDGILHLKKKL